MRKMSRWFSAAIALMLMLSCVACGVKEDDSENDPNKTQVYIGIYDSGYGTSWFDEIKVAFEAIYDDVQLKPLYGKDEYYDGTLLDKMSSNDEEIYLTNQINYTNFVKQGAIMDITDLYEEVVDGKKVSERLYEDLQDVVNVDGKYYGIPYGSDFYHMIYDVDMWDEYGFWLNEAGEFGQWTDAEKSVGQDGIRGTYDDGLPVTYSQFFNLVKEIQRNSCVPFTWSGDYWVEYLHQFAENMKGYYDGESALLANYSEALDGAGVTVKTIDYDKLNRLNHTYGKFSEKEIDAISSDTTITWANYEDFQRQAGVYYTMCFASDVMDTSDGAKYTSFSVQPGESHKAAQERFIRSVSQPSVTGGRVAMLIDGGWWETEGAWVFEDMADAIDEKYSSENRRFGVMPMPLPDDREDTTTGVYSATSKVYVIAKNNPKHPEIVKNFMKFILSKEGMRIMMKNGMTMPFDYDFGSDSFANTYYQQQRVDLITSNKVVYALHKSATGKRSESNFYSWNFDSSARNHNPFYCFFANKFSSPEEYFIDSVNYYKTNAKTLLVS